MREELSAAKRRQVVRPTYRVSCWVHWRIIAGSSWLATALSTGRSNAVMRCAFSNRPAMSGTSKGFRKGKNVFKNNDIVELQEVTDTELVLHDGRRMRRDG